MNWKVQSLLNKGYTQIEAGNFREAVKTFEQAVTVSPDRSELYAFLGEAYFLNREFTKAAQAFSRRDELVLQADPLTPYIEGYRGCIAFELGDYEKADQLLQKISQQEIKDAEIVYRLGMLEILRGKLPQAYRWLNQLDKLDPAFSYRKIQKLCAEISSAEIASQK